LKKINKPHGIRDYQQIKKIKLLVHNKQLTLKGHKKYFPDYFSKQNISFRPFIQIRQ